MCKSLTTLGLAVYLPSLIFTANNTAQINDLPFNYIPTEWVGITFVALFSLTTGEIISPLEIYRN